jgi:hypothetical protein
MAAVTNPNLVRMLFAALKGVLPDFIARLQNSTLSAKESLRQGLPRLISGCDSGPTCVTDTGGDMIKATNGVTQQVWASVAVL